MKLENNSSDSTYAISAYDETGIKINDEIITSSFIIAHDRLIKDWKPSSYTQITIDDLEKILFLKPEIIIIGSGIESHFPSPSLLAPILSKNIGFEVMDTFAACRCYSILASEGRNVAAGLIKTCPE